ncbi:TonB-dependent receptor [Geothrix sp. PMB-07]|uniref:TonB-dependent receptor n=1 Tax=Geothrix sp. PMB-07 TaxID=3068640 RepID=UPI00274126AA|nr:TonB-dependent receptor [Geothrix sp. PMB-07]WLT33487.1 TonB-dependent receptor [Geothrix sp. PMB-07]
MNRLPLRPLAFLLASGPLFLAAQGVQTSNIDGEVRDPQGRPVVGAQVVLTSPALQGLRTHLTDAQGRFSSRLLPPGEYLIAVTKAEHQTLKAPFQVNLGQGYTPRLVLRPIDSATVVVSSTFSQLDKAEVGNSSNFQFASVEALPTGRNPEDLLALTPGVTDTQKINGNVSIRGALTSNNKFLIDGQDVTDPKFGNRGVDPISDAIQEVQIITGAISAEYGDVDGGVVNSLTKSGGNQFTGILRSTLSKDAWNAVQPLQSRVGLSDKLNHNESLSVGGYFIKDRFWFFLSGYRESQSLSKSLSSITTNAGTPYTSTFSDNRLQAKFTYQLLPDQTLSLSYLTNRNETDHVDVASGDLQSLIPQIKQNTSWSLNWAANFGSDLSVEARLGAKKEGFLRGGTLPGVTPILDAFTGAFYLNGVYSALDGGDHRDNRSADVKATYLFEAYGAHQLAFGFNILEGTRRAQDYQSPTNALIVVGRWKPGRTTLPFGYSTFQSTGAKAFDDSRGFYVNDRWSLNSRWSLNLGLRLDRYSAHSEDTSASAGATGWSPRLGLKWDLFGDNTWQATASFNRYNAKALSNIVNSVSGAGNPTEIDYGYTGPYASPGFATQANAANPANWTALQGYASPTLTTRLSPDLRAPHTDEAQVSLAHGFKVAGQEGFAKATLVRREYKDLFDVRVGNDGRVTPPPPYDAVGSAYVQVWENSDLARRTYQALELEGGLEAAAFDLRGNVTWSSLKGNYQGESPGAGPNGQGIKYFSTQDGVSVYDTRQFNPEGPLFGDIPLRVRLNGQYHVDWSWGRTTVGLIYRFDSGAHDSIRRTLTGREVNPAIAAQAQGATFYQYQDSRRGQVVFPSQAYTDLAASQDFRLLRIGNQPLAFFIKLTVANVFNRQQIIKVQNNWNHDTPATGTSSAWLPDAGNGVPHSRGDYGAARSLGVQAGVRF